MTRSATSTLCGAVLLLTTGPAAFALPDHPAEQAELFATCAGRMSAMATRHRAYREDGAELAENQHRAFETLLDAVLPLPGDISENQPFIWRYQGWNEIAALLATSQYSPDQKRVRLARDKMARYIATCRNAVL